VLGDINESTVQSVAAEIKHAGGYVNYLPALGFRALTEPLGKPSDYAAMLLPGRIKSISSRPHLTRLAPWTLWYDGCSVDCARMTTRRFQVANAGVNEVGDYCTPKIKNGKPEKPTMITVDINLLGSLYSKYGSINDTRDIHLIYVYSSCPPGHLLSGTRAETR
jgi:hypothetical protein